MLNLPSLFSFSAEIAGIGQSFSLWAIRIALFALISVWMLEIAGIKRTHPTVAVLWLLGALLAACHSLGALFSFHGGSHSAALAATAEQTRAILGFPVAAGLYVNYLFVAIWGYDAAERLWRRQRYETRTTLFYYLVDGFLAFIAFNGVVVFKSGWLRAFGIAVFSTLVLSLALKLWLSHIGIQRKKVGGDRSEKEFPDQKCNLPLN